MSEDVDSLIGHNGAPGHDVAGDERLELLLQRAERLIEEKKGIQDDLKDVFAEGKAVGYNTPMMREMIRLRAMPSDDRNEREMIRETYMIALGLL